MCVYVERFNMRRGPNVSKGIEQLRAGKGRGDGCGKATWFEYGGQRFVLFQPHFSCRGVQANL